MKTLNKKRIFYKIDWNGGATPTQNSVTPETTGSGHARGKRPCNGNQFFTSHQKNTIFLREKNGVFDCCPNETASSFKRITYPFLKSTSRHIQHEQYEGTYQLVEYILHHMLLKALVSLSLMLMGYKMCKRSALVLVLILFG